MTDPNQKPKNSKVIEEADLLKFQLLSAYVGLRTQDVEAFEKDLELFKVKQELAEVTREKAIHEVLRYQDFLKEKYHLQPSDLVNYADGVIQRDRQPTQHENQKTKNPIGQQTQEKEEAEKIQTDEESVRSP